MEIHVGAVEEVRFYRPTPETSVTGATLAIDGGSPNPMVISSQDDYHYMTLPYFNAEATAEVVWTFTIPGSGSYSQTQYLNVVQPLLPIREVVAQLNVSTTEAREAESAVRHIINAHTGQSFGYTTGNKTAVGDGNGGLVLPARLLTLNSFGVEGAAYKLYDKSDYPEGSPTYFLGNGLYDVVGDGWYIKALRGNPDLGIKADAVESYYTGGIIYNPFRNNTRGFSDDIRYLINGEWGYKEVPMAVKEAAKLLIEDYSCDDSSYRDRYLASLTSPDWRIQFNSGAFRETGNVRADQLLANYRLKRGWAVI